MSEVWYKKLGFDNNPFSIKPAIFNEEVVECEELLDDISLGVLNGNIIFVQGDYGEGKTTLLKRLLGDFGGKKKVIYFSCNRIENELNVKKLLNKRYGFIGKLFDIRPKNMILLLDEAHALSQTDYDKLYQHYADGHFKSIVLVSKEYDKKVFNSKLRSLVKHYRLKTMTEDGAAKLVRDRIGDLPIITDEITKVVYKLSNKNVRTLLQNCEELCKIAAGKGMPTVTEELVFQLFNKDVEQAVQKKVPKKFVEEKKEAKIEIKKENKVIAPKIEKIDAEKKVQKELAEKKVEITKKTAQPKIRVEPEKKPETKIEEKRKVYQIESEPELTSRSMEESLGKQSEEFLESEYY